MKISVVIGFSAVVLVANARGATYVSNFDLFDDQDDVAGNDGWVINDSTFGNSFIANLNGTNAAALGGYWVNPATPTVALTHNYAHYLGGTSMAFDLVLIDSTDGDPIRDTFGVTLRNGGANLITVNFTPHSQSLTPDSPSGADAQWNLSYVVGNDAPVSLTLGVLEFAIYSFNLNFTPNGATTDFNLTVTGLEPVVRTGTIAIDPNTVATDFGFTWTPTDSPSTAGSNYFVIDNLAVIPEASTPLLLCLAGLGAVSRRRRSR